MADRTTTGGSRFRLSVRTSMVSEYRDADGTLGAFELSHRFTTAGALRTSLAQLPGIELESTLNSLWSVNRTRFRFKHLIYEISIPFADIRIAPAEPGAVYPETEDLMRLLAENLVPRWMNRARSRFFGN